MSNVNFSELQSVSSIDVDAQICIRLNNALSGSDGFAKITTTGFEKSLGTFTTVQGNSANWNTAYTIGNSNQAALTTETNSRIAADATLNTLLSNEVTNRIAADALKADLVNGVIPSAQIPAIAISTFLGSVSSQSAMLTLTGQSGDWCNRSDTSTAWVVTDTTSYQLSSWAQINYPVSPVLSVNSQTGVVVLGKADISLANVDNTSDINKPISAATQTALDDKLYISTAISTYQPVSPKLSLLANSGILSSTNVYNLTGSIASSVVDLAGTWNTTGTPTAIKLNITNTASNAGSLLMDLKSGGSSKFTVGVLGDTTIGSSSITGAVLTLVSSYAARTISMTGSGDLLYNANCVLPANGFIRFGYSGSTDPIFQATASKMTLQAASTFQLGADNLTTPTAQTIKAHNVTTGIGASLTLAGGAGSSSGGAVIIATSLSAANATSVLTAGVDGSITFNRLPSNAPVLSSNGSITFELTNNTTLTIKARGSDGVTRSGVLILS